MELSNLFLNKMEQLNKLSKRLGYYNFKDWAEKQLDLKRINPIEFEEIDIFHQMRNIIAHGFSGRVIVYEEDINKLNEYLKLLNKDLGFEVDDNKLDIPKNTKIRVEASTKTSKTGTGKKANKEEIINYINGLLNEAKRQGKQYIILRAGAIEKEIGLSQRIVSVCGAMYDCMQDKDEVLSAPPSGFSTTVTIKFYL